MEKRIAFTIYRDRKNSFSANDLIQLSRELSKEFKQQITILSNETEDGEQLIFTTGDL